jgi:hypothetical protein
MVLLFLAFVFGEGPPHFSGLTPAETFLFVAMGGLFFGLVLAWKWEGLGGLLSVAGFAAFVALSRRHLQWTFIDIPAAIGVLHLACWWRLRAGRPAELAPWHLPRNTLLGLVAMLALFLLLCANEMFGQPPFMTPALYPSANLLGTWTQATPLDVVLTIHEDASVTGTVAGDAVTSARIAFGRSWFGKLLHWNADYVIRGRISGRDFTAPLMATGHWLDGSLFRDNRPVRLKLRKP